MIHASYDIGDTEKKETGHLLKVGGWRVGGLASCSIESGLCVSLSVSYTGFVAVGITQISFNLGSRSFLGMFSEELVNW